MRFFTQVARFALVRGRYEMWLMALQLGGQHLVAADQLEVAAASRNATLWNGVKMVYLDKLVDTECVKAALYGAVKGDNLDVALEMLGRLNQMPGQTADTDEMLMRAALHGSRVCWDYFVTTLELRSSPDRIDKLVDNALTGLNGHILDYLFTQGELPSIFRNRIMWARNLNDAVRTKNPNYIREVILNAQNLKPEDMREAELFAMRTRNDYLKYQVINSALDQAIGEWAVFKTMTPRAKAMTAPVVTEQNTPDLRVAA